MTADRRMLLALDLKAEAERPCGTLRLGERSWPFCGWLGLAVALEQAIQAAELAPEPTIQAQEAPTQRPPDARSCR